MLKINVWTVTLFPVYMPNIHHKPTKWLIQQPVDACWSSSFEVRIEVRRSLESQWQPGETRENPLESKILRYTDIDSTFCPTTSSCSYLFLSLTKPLNIPQQTNQKKRKRKKNSLRDAKKKVKTVFSAQLAPRPKPWKMNFSSGILPHRARQPGRVPHRVPMRQRGY